MPSFKKDVCMTTPRSCQIDLGSTPFYHCIARCVRRSYLTGYNFDLKKDFSHRKPWIVDRIKFLAKAFYINICAYAIMSNHYHLVLHVDDTAASHASLDELLYRWHLVFPADSLRLQKLIQTTYDNEALKESITKKLKSRLSSISWYMRCLNEVIARLANKEDNCKGRFWEGRFKSQALLDEGALLCAMAYVDLNPVRAGIASTPENSDYTSIQERIRQFAKTANSSQPYDLMPFQSKVERVYIDFKLEDYFRLVDETGRLIRNDKKGAIPESLMPLLDRIQLTQEGWFRMIEGIEKEFYYAIGNSMLLKAFIPSLQLRKAKCLDLVEDCYQDEAA
jgi:REP element-mobilizing transposase RayT